MPQTQTTTAPPTSSSGASETSSLRKGSTKGSDDSSSNVGDYDTSLGLHVFRDFARDQKGIWTSPFHVRLVDAEWLVPLGGVATAMFATDTEVSKHLSNSPSRISTSNSLSNYGVAALAGAAGGMYLWGHFVHNDHLRETGFLAGEAAVDSLAASYALKYALGRERPLQNNYQGNFWAGGVSLPSEHSSAAWSIAGVIAHEYPGPLTSIVSYGLAAAVSSARVSGKDHFPSDVLIGSALGWFIGQEVYRHHHDPTLGGGDWETYAESHERGPNRPSNNVGSPYVELDSWIYPALQRLVALGYIDDAFLGLRPWTRRECVRLLEEAEDTSRTSERPIPEAEKLVDILRKEFNPDTLRGSNAHFHLNSVYERFTDIAGEPLRDGYDFGQTIINDYGRPFAEGVNDIAGVSGWATANALVGYARVEYQYSPSSPPLPEAARNVVGIIERTNLPYPDTPFPAVNRVDLLEGYAGLTLDNWQVTYGKQTDWWGPAEAGPMMYSNNAEPLNMFRINRVSPFRLPSILGFLGPMRVEFFIGQLAGQHWVFDQAIEENFGSYTTLLNPQPFIHGEAFSFKPTPNVEFGFNRTTIFGGIGQPFTPHRFISSLFSLSNAIPGSSSDPGDRRSGFNLTYRLPFVRNWLTFYADGFSEDQITPVAYWDRSAWISGLYMPQVPGLRKLDLRIEGLYTDLTIGGQVGYGFFYFNSHYLNGYTNWGNLIGSWIGRDGQGAQAWSTYWFNPRSKLQLVFRHQKVSKQFIPGGGTLTDGGVNADILFRSNFSVSAKLQYERWNFPVLASVGKNNVAASIQFTYWPSFGKGGVVDNGGSN